MFLPWSKPLQDPLTAMGNAARSTSSAVGRGVRRSFFGVLGYLLNWFGCQVRIFTIGPDRLLDLQGRLLPHERTDAIRPRLGLSGALAQSLFWIVTVLIVLAAQHSMGPDPIINVIALGIVVVGAFFVHRSTLRLRVALSNLPYDEEIRFYWKQLGKGIQSGWWPERLAFVGLVGVALLDLIMLAGVRGVFISVLAAILLAATLLLASIAAFQLGTWYVKDAKHTYGQNKIYMGYDAKLAKLAGTNNATLQNLGAVSYPDGKIRLQGVQTFVSFDDIDALLLKHNLDHLMLISEGSTPDDFYLTLADEQCLERRRLYRMTGGLVVAETALPEESYHDKPVLIHELSHKFTSAKLPELQGIANEGNYTITGYNLSSKPMTSKMTPVNADEKLAYERVARLLKVKVWDLSMKFEWVDNDEEDRDLYPQRIETLTVYGAPVGGLTDEDRKPSWAGIVQALPKGSNGWTFDDDSKTGVVVLRYGKPLALPELVRLADLLPERVLPEDWYKVVTARRLDGRPSVIDIKNGPHLIAAGPTSSGKTTFLLAVIANIIMHGGEVVFAEPTKKAMGLKRLAPWCKVFINRDPTLARTARMMERLYAEYKRRQVIIDEYDADFWDKVPLEVRQRENIVPMMGVIDEFTSLVKQVPTYKGMPDDILEKLEKLNGNKGRILFLASTLAREARAVGIHLAIAAQRPDANIIGGEFRDNISSGVITVAPSKPPTSQLSQMVHPGRSEEIWRINTDLNKGGLKGLAIVGGEEGDLDGVRVGYASLNELLELLSARGAKQPEQWDLTEAIQSYEEEDDFESQLKDFEVTSVDDDDEDLSDIDF